MPTPPAYLLPAMQAFRSGDMAGALVAAETALVDHPDDLPLLALASLAALQLASPERAIPHLRTHHALAPSDDAVKANLATALAETGAREEALALAQGSTHHALARLEGFLRQETGDNAAAMIAYERAVMAKPGDMQSWNNLGNLRAAEGDTDGAVAAFEKAITLAPNQLDIYLNLSEVLSRADRQAARLVTTSAALVQAPDDIEVLTEHGIALVANDRHTEAVDILQSAVDRLSNQQQPQIHLAHIELAVLLETLNRIPELEALVTRCEADGIADHEMAFLKAWMLRRIGDYEAAWQFAKDIPDTINPVRTAQLQADIADRMGDTDRAFAEFTRMNELAVAESGPPPAGPSYREHVEAETAFWTAERLASLSSVPIEDGHRDPVFLVGFPRSGTTLLDTMLMAAPSLHVLEEQPVLSNASAGLDSTAVLNLSDEDVLRLRARYFAQAAAPEGTRIVDKHPLQMARLPLIHHLFPKAKIILAERHPYDVVLSCFMANFRLNWAMRSFTTMEEAARTYDTVFAAWDHAHATLPIDLRRIRYERLIADTQSELEPLVTWLGLPWSSDFLDNSAIAGRRGRIKTASYSQVGQPLYERAIGRWEKYRDQIAPAMPLLLTWAKRLKYKTE